MNIYLKNETDFDNNGLGFLTSVLEAKVNEELNGEYYLQLKYPINAQLSEYLVVGNIIKCNVGFNNYQLFRINSIDKTFYEITVNALHIFYDLNSNFIINSTPTNKNPGDAVNWLLNRAENKTSFTASSDITTLNTAKYVRRNITECIMGDIDNSILKKFGGELERDNYNIKILSRRGNNNNLKLIIGKNIQEINISIDISSLCTRIYPVGYDGLVLPENNKYVDSPLINNYPSPLIKKYLFSDIKYDPDSEDAYHTLDEAYEALRNASQALFDNGLDKPSINIKINWLELSKTKEYYNKYNFLETVHLGDTITAQLFNLNYETRVIKTTYNVLTDSFDAFEVGTVKTSLNSYINSIVNETKELNLTSYLKQAQDKATKLLTTAMGGNVYKTRSELFIMDTNDPNTAKKVWRWNLNGLGYSSTGINGPYGIAITGDGSIVADFITSGKINTSLIEGYDSLVQKVENVADLTREVTSTSYIEITNAFKSNALKFEISGEMSLIYPEDTLYPENTLYPLDSYLIIQNASGDSNKIHLPLYWLNVSDNVSDKFVIEDNKAKIIRYISVVGGQKSILETPQVEDLGSLELPLNEGYNKLWLESFSDKQLQYSCKYALINDYTDVFATRTEMNSSITMTKNEIELSTQQKIETATGSDELIAKINLKPGQIDLTGTVTANENFKVLQDGSILAKNGSFSGNIFLNEGGKVIGGDGILSVMIVNASIWSLRFLGGQGLMPLGFDAVNGNGVAQSQMLEFIIPSNFKPQKAYIYLKHKPITHKGYFSGGASEESYIGYSRNVKAYICTDNSFSRVISYANSAPEISGNYNEIANCFGSGGFTGSSSGFTQATSIDISNYIKNPGTYSIRLKSDSSPSGMQQIYESTGGILAQLYIFGYESENIS